MAAAASCSGSDPGGSDDGGGALGTATAAHLLAMFASVEVQANELMDEMAAEDRAAVAARREAEASRARGAGVGRHVDTLAAMAGVVKGGATDIGVAAHHSAGGGKDKKERKKGKKERKGSAARRDADFGFDGVTGRGGLGRAGREARDAAAELTRLRCTCGEDVTRAATGRMPAPGAAGDVPLQCAGCGEWVCGWCFRGGLPLEEAAVAHARACVDAEALRGEGGYASRVRQVVAQRFTAMHAAGAENTAIYAGHARLALRELLLSLTEELAAVGAEPEEVYEAAVFPPGSSPRIGEYARDAGMDDEEWAMYGGGAPGPCEDPGVAADPDSPTAVSADVEGACGPAEASTPAPLDDLLSRILALDGLEHRSWDVDDGDGDSGNLGNAAPLGTALVPPATCCDDDEAPFA